MNIDATGLDHRQLNDRLRAGVAAGETCFVLDNVCGQRYIAAGFQSQASIEINGIPGNDLGAFMDGPELVINGNGQDGVGNTMNAGSIVIRGDARDIVGHSMRGGSIFVRGDVGYRVGIHMKSYETQRPVIVAGGVAGNFFGEYMAGGTLVVLNLFSSNGASPVGSFVGTGMHGGVIYLRGQIEEHQLGKEVKVFPSGDEDREELTPLLDRFYTAVKYEGPRPKIEEFVKLLPVSHRPYGRLYAY